MFDELRKRTQSIEIPAEIALVEHIMEELQPKQVRQMLDEMIQAGADVAIGSCIVDKSQNTGNELWFITHSCLGRDVIVLRFDRFVYHRQLETSLSGEKRTLNAAFRMAREFGIKMSLPQLLTTEVANQFPI